MQNITDITFSVDISFRDDIYYENRHSNPTCTKRVFYEFNEKTSNYIITYLFPINNVIYRKQTIITGEHGINIQCGAQLNSGKVYWVTHSNFVDTKILREKIKESMDNTKNGCSNTFYIDIASDMESVNCKFINSLSIRVYSKYYLD